MPCPPRMACHVSQLVSFVPTRREASHDAGEPSAKGDAGGAFDLASVMRANGITDNDQFCQCMRWCEAQLSTASSMPEMLQRNPWAGPDETRKKENWSSKYAANVGKIDTLCNLLEQMLQHRGSARLGLPALHVLWHAVVGTEVPAKLDDFQMHLLDGNYPEGVKAVLLVAKCRLFEHDLLNSAVRRSEPQTLNRQIRRLCDSPVCVPRRRRVPPGQRPRSCSTLSSRRSTPCSATRRRLPSRSAS